MVKASVLTVLAMGGVLVIGCKKEETPKASSTPTTAPAPTTRATMGTMTTDTPGMPKISTTLPIEIPGRGVPTTGPIRITPPPMKLPTHPTTGPSVPGGISVPDFNK